MTSARSGHRVFGSVDPLDPLAKDCGHLPYEIASARFDRGSMRRRLRRTGTGRADLARTPAVGPPKVLTRLAANPRFRKCVGSWRLRPSAHRHPDLEWIGDGGVVRSINQFMAEDLDRRLPRAGPAQSAERRRECRSCHTIARHQAVGLRVNWFASSPISSGACASYARDMAA